MPSPFRKKEGPTDTRNSVDDSLQHCVVQKKPFTTRTFRTVHLQQVQEQAKLTYDGRNQKAGVGGGDKGERGMR